MLFTISSQNSGIRKELFKIRLSRLSAKIPGEPASQPPQLRRSNLQSYTKETRSKLGSRREIRPGVWQVRVSKGYRRDGSQRVAFRTIYGNEQDAIAAIAVLSREMDICGTLGDKITLSDYFYRHFLPERQMRTTNANTATYRTVFRCHIEPALGDYDLNSISNIDIQSWIDLLPPQSATAYVRALRAILNQAHFDHALVDNPVEGYRFRMPRGRRSAPLPVWGAQEVAEALVALRGHQLQALWLCMVGCGLSRSEALALTWDNITWHELPENHWSATLEICAAATRDDGLKEPKNDRRWRSVPMRPPFSDELHVIVGAGPICQSRNNGRYTGRRLTAGYIPKRWKALFNEDAPLYGLPFVPINRMRATYSTLMQRAGVDSTVINAVQGRSEGSAVLYSNYLVPGQDTFSTAVDRMVRLIDSA